MDFFGDIRLVKMDVISFIERLGSKKENEPLKNKMLKFIKLSNVGGFQVHGKTLTNEGNY